VTPPSKVLPQAVKRLFTPELTGYWESAVVAPNHHPPLLVQISQAGGAVAIWFCRPPTGMAGAGDWVLKDAQGTAHPQWGHGVATAYLADRDGRNLLESGGKIDFNWLAVESSDQPGPYADQLGRLFNPLDPSMLDKSPPGLRTFEGNGVLTLARRDPVTLRISFDSGNGTYTTLTQVRPGARLPRSVIDRQPPELRRLALVDQVRPIPSTLEQRMLSLFEGPEPRLAPRLRAWEKADGQQRKLIARQIAAELEFGLDEPWRTKLLDLITLSGGTSKITLGDQTKTYLQWLSEVLSGDATDGGKGQSDVRNAINQLGVSTTPFIYALSFNDVGVALKRPGFGIGANQVSVGIQKFRLIPKKDAKGAVVYHEDTGLPVEERREQVPMTGPPSLTGVFGRVDAGLAFDWMGGKPKVEDLSKPAAADNANLGTVEFISALDLKDTKEFGGAWFTTASFVVAQGKFGNWLKGQVSDSALWELHLPAHERMVAIVVADRLKGPKISNWGSISNPQWWKDWKPEKIKLTLFRIGMGVGYLERLEDKGGKPPVERTPVFVREKRNAMVASAPALFEYDSSNLDFAKPGAVTTPRMRFELALAELRGLIAAGGGGAQLIAMTSPEGFPQYNQVLSENRAAAVRQALSDALGPALFRAKAVEIPLGERPSLMNGKYSERGVDVEGGGLPDPEKYPTREAFFASPDGVTARRWPAWRRVDVGVEGTLVVSFVIGDSPEPRDKP
jgi:hypothetical protein